jgi:hypothetical protein
MLAFASLGVQFDEADRDLPSKYGSRNIATQSLSTPGVSDCGWKQAASVLAPIVTPLVRAARSTLDLIPPAFVNLTFRGAQCYPLHWRIATSHSFPVPVALQSLTPTSKMVIGSNWNRDREQAIHNRDGTPTPGRRPACLRLLQPSPLLMTSLMQ